jgi:hypothetical protein
VKGIIEGGKGKPMHAHFSHFSRGKEGGGGGKTYPLRGRLGVVGAGLVGLDLLLLMLMCGL